MPHVFLILVILQGVKWCIIGDLICIFLMTNGVLILVLFVVSLGIENINIK